MKNKNILIGILIGLVVILISYVFYYTYTSNNLLRSYQVQQKNQDKQINEDELKSDLKDVGNNIIQGSYDKQTTSSTDGELCPSKTFINSSLGPNAQPFLSDKYIEVISPKSGDVYNVGDTLEIKWKNCNLASSYNSVAVILLDDNNNDCGESFIAKNVSMNQGINSYNFKLPSSVNECLSSVQLGGGNYRIMISDGSVGSVGHNDSSGVFSIETN